MVILNSNLWLLCLLEFRKKRYPDFHLSCFFKHQDATCSLRSPMKRKSFPITIFASTNSFYVEKDKKNETVISM